MKKPIEFFTSKADKFLLWILAGVLITHYSNVIAEGFDNAILAFFASVATLPVVISAYRSIQERKISVDLLASVALVVSLINQEWASAVFINLMLTSARLFSNYTENKSRSAIKSLLKLRPQKVKIKKGKDIFEEPTSKVKKGDLLVIELGDRIPVDGVVVSGNSMIDQSSLTGESLPIAKKEGDQVLSSTLNVSGSMVIRAEKVGKNTVFEKIIKLVEESQKNKVGIRTIADRFASWYVVVALVGAISLYLYSRNTSLVLSVLLVTCADDIAVAVPMAFSAAIGSAAHHGIIIKGGEYLEILTKVKTVILDKTGTITQGKLQVEDIISLGANKEKDVLRVATIADCFSKHPIAKAIIKYADAQGIKGCQKPDDFEEVPGKGSVALFDSNKYLCGKLSFLQEFGVRATKAQIDKLEEIKSQRSANILPVGFNDKLIGFLVLSDETRPEAKGAIEKMRRMGISRFIMLTGDNEKVAKEIAEETGIEEFHANLLPEDKIKYVKEMIGRENKVMMVGDGINDAASLALADTGIAMGAIGTDAAIEAADIALMKDDISKIPQAIRLSHKVMKIARQDFVIWGVVNSIGLALVFGKIIGPEGSAAFNFVTDFLPLLNSLRLFGYKFSKM